MTNPVVVREIETRAALPGGRYVHQPLVPQDDGLRRKPRTEAHLHLVSQILASAPEDVIEPYELTLKKMKTAERRQWANNVIAALRQSCDLEADQFVFLAGVPYRENLVPHIKHYTVRVIDGNATLLKGCATKPEMYYDVQQAVQLNSVFSSIAQNLANRRITQ